MNLEIKKCLKFAGRFSVGAALATSACTLQTELQPAKQLQVQDGGIYQPDYTLTRLGPTEYLAQTPEGRNGSLPIMKVIGELLSQGCNVQIPVSTPRPQGQLGATPSDASKRIIVITNEEKCGLV